MKKESNVKLQKTARQKWNKREEKLEEKGPKGRAFDLLLNKEFNLAYLRTQGKFDCILMFPLF